MAWLAVDEGDQEYIYDSKPKRYNQLWDIGEYDIFKDCVELPKGSIEKLIGRRLTWEDEPVEIK